MGYTHLIISKSSKSMNTQIWFMLNMRDYSKGSTHWKKHYVEKSQASQHSYVDEIHVPKKVKKLKTNEYADSIYAKH